VRKTARREEGRAGQLGPSLTLSASTPEGAGGWGAGKRGREGGGKRAGERENVCVWRVRERERGREGERERGREGERERGREGERERGREGERERAGGLGNLDRDCE